MIGIDDIKEKSFLVLGEMVRFSQFYESEIYYSSKNNNHDRIFRGMESRRGKAGRKDFI